MKQGKSFILVSLAVAGIIWSVLYIKVNCFSFYQCKMSSSGIYSRTYYQNSTFRYTTPARYSIFVSKPLNFSISDFLSTDLVEHPEEANKLSVLLTTRMDIITEAQRIHMNIFSSILGKYKYAMLFHYDPAENKGDSAVSVGELNILYKLNVKVVFACVMDLCEKEITNAQRISKKYTNKELVILFQGGGNVGWRGADRRRAIVITPFIDFHIIMFPQSILYIKPHAFDYCKNIYASHKNLTFVWRDKESYKLGKSLFPNVKSLLSPDMAYQLGFVSRYMIPTQDIIWIKRNDIESPVYTIPSTPIGYRMHVTDWMKWKTPAGTSSMEDVFLMAANGMTFLQRGRVVITDRLHGHILSTLLGIPHVYIDNRQRKISNYHNTWTASVENIVLANSSDDALVQAKKLLNKLDRDLPPIKGFYTNTG